MKRNSKKGRDNTAFLYVRLSRDDNLEGESYSISNQKKLLTKAAKDAGYTNIVIFADDGVSGVTMNRPGYQAMIAELEKDHAAAVFVKDMSRLGRNYIEVGRLTEEFLPQHDIRLVAISDGIDTNEGENELAPIRNLFNERYATMVRVFITDLMIRRQRATYSVSESFRHMRNKHLAHAVQRRECFCIAQTDSELLAELRQDCLQLTVTDPDRLRRSCAAE